MTDIDSLFDSLEALQADKKLPPVAQWQPERVGQIDIRIARDGAWYHEGAPFKRPALVKLFSTVLRRDPDGFCLVTPAEKLLIEVEDVPFLAIDLDVRGEGAQTELLFSTSVDDYVVADAAHPIRVEQNDAQPRPYIMVRDGLEALINRPVFYRLVEHAVQEDNQLAVYSRGTRFLLGNL